MRKIIWDSMLDAEMNERYWSKLSNRYYNREQKTKIFLAIMTSGTVASWSFWSTYEVLWKLLSAASALIAIALPILNWPKIIQSMNVLTEKWSLITNDYELLWLDVKKGVKEKDESRIKKELKNLMIKECTLSQKEVNLPDDPKLLKKCMNEVKKSRGI
ncbi:MAG TPA: hypothetical protein VMU29_02450 [Smithella sp.]|nr:hypothetical protein [Smithella sp.]